VQRREFITLFGVVTAWPLVARVQQNEGMRRIGVLMQVGDNDVETQARVKVLQDALRKLGWSNGRNIQFDMRWAEGKDDRARKLAKELADLGPDVIVAGRRLGPPLETYLRHFESVYECKG
jgi:putative ABC transport system substrate-binding protein